MAEKSIPGGMIMPYGVAIGNALARPDASTDELLALRQHAHAIVSAQGDLVAAVKALDAKIASRGGAEAAAAAPAVAVERFVAQIEGAPLSDAVKAEIDQAIQKAVTAAVAKIDTGGAMVATPLAQLRSLDIGGLGGIILGLILTHVNPKS